jgi:DNA polymerase-3 subunit gamma/tau
MKTSLANKYRPKTFEEVCSQESIVESLNKQVETGTFGNAYLLVGKTGCGKTTTARILGNSINKGLGEPIEIDAASNNSAEAMRELVKNANQRSIDSEYKIIIIDEAHLLSSAAWNVLLKTLEEPPKYTIFILCTTEEKKVPATIVNRTLCYHISAIPSNIINDRLCYIAESEGFTNYKQSCEYISKNSDNSLRQAIANLEKVSYLGKDFSLKQTLRCLGSFSYNDLFDLTDALLDNNNDIEQIKTIIRVVEDIYLQGKDLKQFVHDYTVFILDIIKYVTFKSFDLISIPESMIEDIHAITGNENSACLPIYRRISENLFTLSLIMNNTKDLKNTLELNLLKIKGGKDLCL